MECRHERIKCTDNVFYCAVCGAKVEMPTREEKPAEAKKTPVKRKRKENEE